MKRIGLLTAGGDCPGLNAAIRSVVRISLQRGLEVIGIRRGYKGLIHDDTIPLESRAVGGIINKGGTILLTARCDEFHTKAGLRQAAETIANHRLDGLVVIGGNGSLKGAWELVSYTPCAIVGIPKSIDNDLIGTDYSIGFDTAVNTAVEAIDRIRDTATSHERLFLIEVMGRKSGFVALWAGIAGGAEGILIPERKGDLGALCQRLIDGHKRGKISSIVVLAEGDEPKVGGAFEVAKKLQMCSGYEVRVSILGHQQRGGSPTAFDRVLASRLGEAAVNALLAGKRSCMVGLVKGRITLTPLKTVWATLPKPDRSLIRLAEQLAW